MTTETNVNIKLFLFLHSLSFSLFLSLSVCVFLFSVVVDGVSFIKKKSTAHSSRAYSNANGRFFSFSFLFHSAVYFVIIIFFFRLVLAWFEWKWQIIIFHILWIIQFIVYGIWVRVSLFRTMLIVLRLSFVYFCFSCSVFSTKN